MSDGVAIFKAKWSPLLPLGLAAAKDKHIFTWINVFV